MTGPPRDITPLPDLIHSSSRAGPARERRPVYVDLLPPCNAGCPAGENIQAWLAHVQAGEHEKAWRELVADNPLPAIHGRVCYHPCESVCNRANLDSAVSIHAVERFLGDLARERGWQFDQPPAVSGRRVLVIGAGPSGLSAAYHLARLGHEVEIRDAGAAPGGMMRYGIPAYRLPREMLDGELQRILGLGVRITCDHRVEDLIAERDEGAFDAVFVAVGAHLSKRVEIPARDAGPIVDALSFLRDVASGEQPVIGRRVAVYGGGNTAMDAARVARRLGAEETLIVYRRTREQMPAHAEEAQDAEREGVRINWLRTITAFDGPQLQVEVMELDESGFPQPTGRFETLAADTVILALGQETETAFMRGVPGIEFDNDGIVHVSSSLMTGCPGVFAGGDMVPSERTVTVGVGHGKRAAREIDAWLRGTPSERPPKHPAASFELLNLWYFGDSGRRRQPELEPSERIAGFDEVIGGLTVEQARFESQRCLSCGNCCECDGCLGACPEDAVIKLGPGHRYRFDYDRCTGCQACFDQCPGARDRDGRGAAVMRATIDGNEAAASVAYRLNEICCIFPITPSSPMAELADEWSGARRPNVWGTVPAVIEMQSEGGAAGALHGALQGGALATTFTASQGLLLMIPNMYKIAGELTAAVMHVAARSLAAQGLSIFGDHSDVMAVRQTGFALLASASVQEAHDLALVAQAATLGTRVPFVHFFDGFRTSHELNTVQLLSDDDLRALVPEELVRAHRSRALSPERPFIRGTAQNPDVYFQARETVNPFYARVPELVQGAMDRLSERTGRNYRLVEYSGHPEPERVLVVMGSGGETARETVAFLQARGERVGVVQIRLYRPFPARELAQALPTTVRHVAVLDRTKEPGSLGEPLFLDVLAALSEAHADGERGPVPSVIGGRYGLSSKEFTPAMVAGVFDELTRERPRRRFTIGITDDVSGTSLTYDASLDIEPAETVRAVFFGLGSDGTVGANKNTIKILGDEEHLHAQGYFVYDSKKSGSQTVSHLRFGPHQISAPYLISQASFIGCHQFGLLERAEVLGRAAPGATLLLNTRLGPDRIWDAVSRPVQEQLLAKRIELYVIDAARIARDAGLAGRTNTVLQTCFFAISGVLEREHAIERIKASIARTYGKRGEEVVRRNQTAVDHALQGLQRVQLPEQVSATREPEPVVPAHAPEFVRTVTAAMMAGRGDELPVSALPVDGTYPSGTTSYEKRNVSELVAHWDPDLCIQCGNCSFVCPHSVIRSRYYEQARLEGAPAGFQSANLEAPGLPDTRFTLQVYVEDCTGCALCVEACPVSAPADTAHRAINLEPREPIVAAEREAVAFFEQLPLNDRSRVDFGTVRGTQFLEPLFEFSGACEGCGETPYLKLLSQLFGDRLTVANATGCSSIYGGNLPTTPWTVDADGRGPAWSNSLFEDNAEFGLGLRLAADRHTDLARRRLSELRAQIGAELVDEILAATQLRESELRAQRERISELERRLDRLDESAVADLRSVIDHLIRRSVWIVGGDGWAYDIGSGGLDHVLASGHNVNVLVLDTEVYSNTGGQMSKATPLGAVAKFASGGKTMPTKDLALQAIAYANVYVARVAMGADPQQTLTAFREAEAYDGPSLVIAYSHCIAHGFEMRDGLAQQYKAVASGHWPLIRYDPMLRAANGNPFLLDSPRPRTPLSSYRNGELRFRALANTDPAEAERLQELAQQTVHQRWQIYEEMATRGARDFPADARKDR